MLQAVHSHPPLASHCHRHSPALPPAPRRLHAPRGRQLAAVRSDGVESSTDSGTSTSASTSNATPRYSGSSFVRAPLIAPYQRTAECRRCGGGGTVTCATCSGTGRLGRGGYQKKNSVNAARIIGSKWTAMERTFGWRHFRVLQKRGQGKAGTYVLMSATCDEATQLWVNIQNLRDRARWASGWLQKTEMQALQQQMGDGGAALEGSAAPLGTSCKACGASGSLPCPLCSLAGQVVEL